MTVYIQIGTNSGNDNFRKLVILNKPSKVILIEPNSSLINIIEANYINIPNVHIVNKAIYYEDNMRIPLYIPNTINNIAANGYYYSDLHYSLVPMNDWGEKTELQEIKADTIIFESLCKKFSITNIDYLQIDTEGFDTEILQLIDFTKYTINKLRYEKWPFNPECFTKHNNTNSLGINGMKIVEDILLKNNYILQDINDEDGNDIIATKMVGIFSN
jgi:hypothetical protein